MKEGIGYLCFIVAIIMLVIAFDPERAGEWLNTFEAARNGEQRAASEDK
ncbi:MAG: hypothetical protein AAGG69_02200 [Pseudomonadota bacterium]